ncbi:hypothetical protein LBMAG53_26830 [Planctomycetota bacterium]|nr:hypothetical protein LBMAG53_26830 [Planctomycetota bacterium]
MAEEEAADDSQSSLPNDDDLVRFNTKPLSAEALLGLSLTGFSTSRRALDQYTGRRFVSRNGSLVMLVCCPRPGDNPDLLGLCVVKGGHEIPGYKGRKPGSIYYVDDDGNFHIGGDSETDVTDELHGMDVVAEVIED